MKNKIIIIIILAIFLISGVFLIRRGEDIFNEKIMPAFQHAGNTINKQVDSMGSFFSDFVLNLDTEKINLRKRIKEYISPYIQNFEKQIINYLESEFEIEIEYGELNYWPLNKITVENVRITNQEGLDLSAGEINVFYRIINIIRDPDNWQDNIYAVEIKEPDLYYFHKDDTGNGIDYDLFEMLNNMKDIKINIENGNIIISNENGELISNKLNGNIKFADSDKVYTSLKSSIIVNGFSLGDILLDINLDQNKWEGNLLLDSVNLNILEKSLPEDFIRQYDLEIKDITGSGLVNILFAGQDFEIKDYTGQIDIIEAEASVTYNSYIKNERIQEIKGKVSINSNFDRIDFNNFAFKIRNNNYNLNGLLKNIKGNNPQISGSLVADRVDLSSTGINFEKMDLPEIEGIGNINLMINGDLKNPVYDLKFNIPQIIINDKFSQLVNGSIRYQKGIVYIDQIKGSFNPGNEINLNGIIDSNNNKYSLNLDGENIALKRLQNYFGDIMFFDEISEGKVNIEMKLTGRDFTLDNLNALGNIQMTNPVLGYNNIENMKANFWLSDNKLLLNEGLLNLKTGNMEFNGEVNFAEKIFDIQFDGKNMDTAMVKYFTEQEIPQISGLINLQGKVSESFSEPLVSLNMDIDKGKFMEYRFEDFKAVVEYNKGVIDFEKLDILVEEGKIKGNGIIDISYDQPVISAKLNADNINYLYIEKLTGETIPLEGEIKTAINISGNLIKPNISGEIISNNTVYLYGGNRHNIDKISLMFNWQEERPFNINDLYLERGETSLQAGGQFFIDKNELDINFEINNLALEELKLVEGISGRTNLIGEIKGDIFDPHILTKIETINFAYKDRYLEEFSGYGEYKDGNLVLNDIKWQLVQGEYVINGDIFTIDSKPELNLAIKTEKGKVKPLLDMFNIDLPFDFDYSLMGEVKVRGNIGDLHSEVDIAAYSNEELKGDINIKGVISDKIDLKVKGRNICVSTLLTSAGQEIYGKTEIDGDITGDINNIFFNFDTSIGEFNIEGFEKVNITGNIKMEEGKMLSIKQNINLPDDNKVTIDGDILLEEQNILDVVLDIDRLRLDLLSTEYTMQGVDGYLQGRVSLKGTFEEPELDGNLFISGQDMEVGLPAKVNLLEGDLVFSGQTVNISNLEGIYGNEPVEIAGNINLFDLDNFWNIELKGNNIPLDHGSYQGQLNPEIRITGAFYHPYISGEALTHNFTVRTPFRWPRTEGESSAFEPELNVILYPGQNVYFQSNDRVNILIQEGHLRLIYENKEFKLEGELNSTQGTFDFYNNKFMLERARAIFHSYQGYIPQIHASAATIVDGTRIIVRVDGSAENFTRIDEGAEFITFDSQPRLPDEEIFNLLAKRGALGELISGEDVNLIDLASREFIRFLQETFQMDFVEHVGRNIQEFFRLDRIEIDTYDIGLENRVNVYLGKRITERLYLEYSSQLTPRDRDDEISFKYRLRDGTYFDGSWRDDGEYRILLETSLDF